MVQEMEFASLEQELVGDISADQVRMTLSGAESIRAREVNLERSLAGSLEAERASLNQSLAQGIRAHQLELSQSGAMVVRGEEIALTQTCAGIVSGQRIKGDLKAGLVIGGSVEGSVTTILDQRTALTLGAALGISLAFICALRSLLGR